MGDAQFGQALLGLMQQLHVVDIQGLAHHVGGEGDLGGAHAPDMQVVDINHPFQIAQGLVHGCYLNARRHGIKGHLHGIAQQAPAGPGHGQADPDASGGIEPVPVSQAHDDGAEQHRRRHRRIAQQMDHRRPAVEVVAAVVAEQASRKQIHRDADGGGPGHWRADHFGGLAEALDPLHQHHGRGHQDQHRVSQGGQLGAAAKAVGESFVWGATAQPFRPPAEQQAGHVAQVVDRIADQGQGAEAKTDHQLQG